jgi:hypothetical protein
MKQVFEIETYEDFELSEKALRKLIIDHAYRIVGPIGATPFPGYDVKVKELQSKRRIDGF